MQLSRRVLLPSIPLVLAAALLGCNVQPISKPIEHTEAAARRYFPQNLEKEVDLLFVIDNSNSMGGEQENLSRNFGRLIEALRSPRLGPDDSGKPCSETDTSGCKLPNVRIGVVSSDLGAGSSVVDSCERTGGDGGKLQTKPRLAGCTPPNQPWIEYNEGKTNVPVAGDAMEQMKEAFQCLAALGTGGCGFEHTLEAARRALDPQRNTNPGFLRQDAYLAVVFLTDEDDCSAQRPGLFETAGDGANDPLGPLHSFRCFEFGIRCDINGRQEGSRQDCQPGYDWLYPVEDYVTFFKRLKPPGRVMLFAIAGPTNRIEVSKDGSKFDLIPTCQALDGSAAVPALRLKAVVDAFGTEGHFNEGADATGKGSTHVEICSPDFSPALRLLGQKIVGKLGPQCMELPPLTRSGALVCDQGRDLGGVTCARSCLERVDCVVAEVSYTTSGEERSQEVPKCEASKFANPTDESCNPCPCWRLVPKAECVEGSPYGLEVLRAGKAPAGAMAAMECNVAEESWGSPALAKLPQCD